jgi:hypothetical protein
MACISFRPGTSPWFVARWHVQQVGAPVAVAACQAGVLAGEQGAADLVDKEIHAAVTAVALAQQQ